MIELLKLLFSKDFISNAKDIVALIKRSKDWKKDIIKYSGTFYFKDKIDSTVLMNTSVKTIADKGWTNEEQQEARFILNELFENSFNHGTPSKERSYVNAELTITSTFFKLSISDFGIDFDLMKELTEQEAFNPNSDKHRGLSFINKLTPEIYQEKSTNKNTVIVIKRQGLKPLRVVKKGDILVFELGNSTYIDDSNFNTLIDRIKTLKIKEKIVIDFGSSKQMMISVAYRNIRQNLIDANIKSDVQISVCGMTTAPIVIREYFEKHFPTFETMEEAIAYHQEKR